MSVDSAAERGVFGVHLRHQPGRHFDRRVAAYDRLASRFCG
jgi:hypothetical protein